MRKNVALTVVLVLVLSMALSGFVSWVNAQGNSVPSKMNFQGFLTDHVGQPLSGNYTLTFSIYSVPTGGTALWSEAQTVAANKGTFNVMLGDQNALSKEIFTGTSYLGVKIGNDPEMLPRQEMASVPYAIHAQNAYMLDGHQASDFPVKDDLSTPGTINNAANPLDWTKLKNVPPGFADGVDNAGEGSAVKQLIRDFVVATGQNVTAGDVVSFLNGRIEKGFFHGANVTSGSEQIFKLGGTRGLSVAALSPTKIVVTYKDATFFLNRVVVGDIIGDSVSYGPEYTISSAGSSFNNFPISVAALSPTTFVVVYQNVGDADRGTARIGSVSSQNITLSLPFVFSTGTAYDTQMSVTTLSPTKFVVAYSDGIYPAVGAAVIGNVSSNNSIVFGLKNIFAAGPNASSYNRVVTLSSDKFLVAYQELYQGKAIVGNVSGDSIAYGTAAVFEPSEADSITAAALSPNSFVAAYEDRNGSRSGTAIVGVVSGNSISYGEKSVFHSVSPVAYPAYMSIASLSATKFALAYANSDNDIALSYGALIIGDVSGNNITYGSEKIFDPSARWYISAAAISATRFIVVYIDMGNSQYGTSRTMQIGLTGNLVGIAKLSGVGGTTVPVIIGGVSDIHSGLNTGSVYYVTGLGDLTTDVTNWRAGLAISPTELLLDLERWKPYSP